MTCLQYQLPQQGNLRVVVNTKIYVYCTRHVTYQCVVAYYHLSVCLFLLLYVYLLVWLYVCCVHACTMYSNILYICVYLCSICSEKVTFCRPLSQSRVAGKGNVFLGASNKRAKSVVLQIHGLADAVSLYAFCVTVFRTLSHVGMHRPVSVTCPIT